MKKLGLFFVAATALFIACDNTENENDLGSNGSNTQGQTQLVSSIHGYFPNGYDEEDFLIEFSYDNQNRLIQFTNTQKDNTGHKETFTLTYSENSVTLSSNINPENPLVLQLNEKGYVVHSEYRLGGDATDYTYNEQNQLISVRDSYDTEEYVWQNGNIVERRTNSIYGDKDTTWYTYDQQLVNKTNIDIWEQRWIPKSFIPQLFGIENKNLILTERNSYDTAYKDDCIWDYDINADGYIVKLSALEPDENGIDDNPYTIEITYTPVQ